MRHNPPDDSTPNAISEVEWKTRVYSWANRSIEGNRGYQSPHSAFIEMMSAILLLICKYTQDEESCGCKNEKKKLQFHNHTLGRRKFDKALRDFADEFVKCLFHTTQQRIVV